MSKSDRNNPQRSTASESRYTFMDFERDFPDDAACLEWLVAYLYPEGIFCPKCERVTKHHRVKARTSYSCQFCGHHEHPMRGTIFEDSATSLRLWFHAIFLMSQTRCGISAKQLEREIGVTYKTAWRMFNKIRSMLQQDEEPWLGVVEADEAYLGGRGYWKHGKRRSGTPRAGEQDRPRPVFGLAKRGSEQESGRVYVKAIPGNTSTEVLGRLRKKVLPESVVYTDEAQHYRNLHRDGYHHGRVKHSIQVYVDGDVHTQTIEGFWSLVRRGIAGVYHGVGEGHLQSYLDEYAFRYNSRDDARGMFSAFLSRIVKRVPAPEIA